MAGFLFPYLGFSSLVDFLSRGYDLPPMSHRFYSVDFVTNGVGYVSTSFPKGGRQIYLDLSRSLRECMIGPRTVYKQFTPTLFYPDAEQATADQLNKTNHPIYKLDFNHSPVVAVFGALHSLFRPCYHRMGRIVCAVGSQNIDQIEWGLSLAAARLHVKQYHGLNWGDPDEKKESLVKQVAESIVGQLRERRHHAGITNRPQPLCRAGGAADPAGGRGDSCQGVQATTSQHGV